MSRPLALAALLSLPACVSEPVPSDSEGDTTAATSSSSSTGGGASTGAQTSGSPTGDPTGDPTEGGGGSSGEPGSTGDATTTSTTGEPGSTGDGGSSSGGTTGDVGPAPDLPIPSKPCPEIIDGTVAFEPEGLAGPRDVRIWVDPDAAAQADGPVVFWWHGTGGEPQTALYGLGELLIQEVLDAGGIVIAPSHDPVAGVFPWFLVLGEQQDDLILADEVLACAQEQLGVDASRIYSAGFSAGGLHTAQMSIRRSSYLSAVVVYSGGLIFGKMPAYDDPDNKFSAMIFHGGPSDVVVVGFEQASKDYSAYITPSDHFNFLCDHGGGHSIPDAQDSAAQFLFDHPYGTAPSPYAQALPGDFPPYCALN